MEFDNKIMLITYADSIGKNIKDLKNILNKYCKDTIKGIHILPFFPSSGDRGFSPIEYKKVDINFGTFEDIKNLSKDYYLMFDYMINHISKESEFYKDFQKNKDNSIYKDLFIRYKDFWENGYPSQEQIDIIYKRKPRAPYIDITFEDGTSEKLWCTFSEEQIDLNVKTKTTQDFNKENLEFLAQNGASIIRLDAFAYAIKKPDTNCFFIEPDIWNLLEQCTNILKPFNTIILPEIHEHYSIQMKIAEKGYYVYDFSLPMLVLHCLYSGKSERIKNWLKICPRKQFTTLDTHDGIGVVDVKDLLTNEEIEYTKEMLYSKGANVKKIYSTEAYNNLDIYQINCTYYSALGNNDDAYILARAIQFFTPGIPQVYYVGMFAGENDIELLEKTKEGRNINRHYYSCEEVEKEVKRDVVQRLFKLMKFRNEYTAFDGEIEILESDENHLNIKWINKNIYAVLEADLRNYNFEIKYIEDDGKEIILNLN